MMLDAQRYREAMQIYERAPRGTDRAPTSAEAGANRPGAMAGDARPRSRVLIRDLAVAR